jgi:UPF0042 nucleotide-binding protein
MANRRLDLQIILITGMSGSGKSVALHALEDAGFFCVDNLPPELLLPFIALQIKQKTTRVAIAIDVRTASSLPLVPQQLNTLEQQGTAVKSLFLDATTGTLVRRFSETRRRHPLSQSASPQAAPDHRRALVEAIELERQLLAGLRQQAYIIDTSMIRPSQLQGYVKSLISVQGQQLTLVFESFAFKRGIPGEADFVFDVRMLPNPHYEPELRKLTGQDAPVAAFLQDQPDVMEMQEHIQRFLNRWLDAFARDHRSYVTVAIGCTGGQHRSVYLVEKLVAVFGDKWVTLKRHRELDGQPVNPESAAS